MSSRLEAARQERLRHMLTPAAVAFVGGEALLPAIDYLRCLGFPGSMHVVNPRRGSLAGLACVPSAGALERPPDAAFVAVPGAAAIDAVIDLAAAGCGAAVVNSAGFAESGPAGAALQDALREAAGPMPLLGPNCPGFVNFLDGAALLMGNMGVVAARRGVAVLSNGGAYLADIGCSDRSLPIAYMAGLGNQASVTVAELLEVILEDDRVTAVNLYLESIGDAGRLSRCAAKAMARGIPIVVLRAGGSASGKRAARSHTAAIAGDDAVASALFRRLGFIEVATASEAMETMKMLSFAGAPRGRRLGLATSSGTYAVLGADMAERVGLTLPEASAAAQGHMQGLLEPFLVAGNPLDLATGQFWPEPRQRPLFDAFLADGYDVAVQCMSFPADGTWEDESWYRSAAVFAGAAAATGTPAAFVSPTHEGLPRRAREMLAGLGVAPLQGFHDGFRAIAHAADWGAFRDRAEAGGLLLPEAAAVLCPREAAFLDEAMAKRLLRDAGVAVPEGVIWADEDAAPPPGLGYPLALKLVDAGVLHKSDLGAVALDITTPEALLAARARMRSVLDAQGITARRYLVEAMIAGGRAELLVGIRRVPEIGYCLTLAIGGLGVELLADACSLILPVSRADVAAALQTLKLYPLLGAWRGRPAADIEAGLDAVMAMAAFAEASHGRLVELEVNPLILREAGGGAVAADAVLRLIPDAGDPQ